MSRHVLSDQQARNGQVVSPAVTQGQQRWRRAFLSSPRAQFFSEMVFFGCYIPGLMGDFGIPIPLGEPLKLSLVMH